MKAKFLRKGMIIAAMTAAMLAPVESVMAAEGSFLSSLVSRQVNSNKEVKALT